MSRKRICFFASMLCAVSLFTGCVIGGTADKLPQSHFSFPNSNVTPIGPARAQSTQTTIFFPTYITGQLEEDAYRQALQGTGGDLLIDGTKWTVVRMIPIPYIPVYITTYTVEGTAAKMTVGKKELDAK